MNRARAAWDKARDFAAAQYLAFRRRSKWFQYRVYILALYAGLVLVTVFAVMPHTRRNRLDAYVLAARGDFVLGEYILVRNDSSRPWQDVTFTVNGSHTLKAATVEAGTSTPIRLNSLEPPITAPEVQALDIDCSRGHEHYDLNFADSVRSP